jgi:UDP-N-acetylglucosamine 2-epimerase (non-hydrolysing)
MAIKILTVFGTRPEAIKLAPVIKEMKEHPGKPVCKICVTGQHREMLDPFLKLFGIKQDYDLNIMQKDQTLFDVTCNILTKVKEILLLERPDIVLVQGDTTSAFASSLAAFYLKIKIAHVEAGLRSGDKYNPFPEEINRKLIDHMADWHFAPTETARQHLLKEGIPDKTIHITGNTVIDALFMVLHSTKGENHLKDLPVKDGSKLILVTAHRRESFGDDIRNICYALRRIVEHNPGIEIIYPVHLNPNVQKPVKQILGGLARVHLIEPLDYISFIHLMNKSYLILTDSGGIQEEAPSLGKPVLVMRNTTERPEVIEAGAAKLVGTDADSIVKETQRLLDDANEYKIMSHSVNPYGDGKAARRIVKALVEGTHRSSLKKAPGK